MAPRSTVQVIVACLFAFGMVLLTIHIKPYRERANNQLLGLSQINIHLFLFVGLLLQTNPDGITSDQLLFSVVVGFLTTSIVLFTLLLFLRELYYTLLAALHEIDEDEAAEEAAEQQALLALEDAEGACGDDEYDPDGEDAPDWRAPLEEEEPPPCCTPSRLLCLAVSACIALVLGVGIGVSDSAPLAASAQQVARVTLVIERAAVLAGSTKPGITVNGTSPGPLVRVPYGARVEVTVINRLLDDTTSVHWHGMSMRGTQYSDGVIGVTQCGIPAAAGMNSLTYTFTPEQPGTYWYHGHYRGQYPDGLVGAFVVDDGGASIAGAFAAAGNGTGANASTPLPYDADTWVWIPTDWYEAPAIELLPAYMAPGGGDEPIPDAVLVNGQRSDGVTLRTSRDTRQLVRIVNAAAMSMWRVSVDGLPLTLVELDGTAVQPLDVPYVDLNVAQRAAVILDWSRLQADVAGSPALWFRVDAMPSMYWSYDAASPDLGLYGSSTRQPFDPHWRGLIRFDGEGGPAAQPNYTAAAPLSVRPPRDTLNLLAARSWPPQPAPDATHTIALNVAVAFDGDYIRRGLINGAYMPQHAMAAQLAPPELYAYASPGGGPLSDDEAPLSGTLRGAGNAPFVLPYGAVVEMTINNTDSGEHPFHAHGHDFWVVATSALPGAAAQYAPHFVRRDVVSVPAYGWARVRFVADNPGVWLMHCHLDWHMHIGMMATFVEAPSELMHGAASGAFAVPAAHKAACSAPLASNASAYVR